MSTAKILLTTSSFVAWEDHLHDFCTIFESHFRLIDKFDYDLLDDRVDSCAEILPTRLGIRLVCDYRLN